MNHFLFFWFLSCFSYHNFKLLFLIFVCSVPSALCLEVTCPQCGTTGAVWSSTAPLEAQLRVVSLHRWSIWGTGWRNTHSDLSVSLGVTFRIRFAERGWSEIFENHIASQTFHSSLFNMECHFHPVQTCDVCHWLCTNWKLTSFKYLKRK